MSLANDFSQALARAWSNWLLLTSQEYYDLVINQYYNQYLDRAPSSSDKTYWEGQLRGGVSQLAFQELLIGSAEYAAHPPAATGGNADLWPS